MIKPGDKMYSIRSNIALVVLEVGIMWRKFESVKCEDMRGRIHLYMIHNLRSENEKGRIVTGKHH